MNTNKLNQLHAFIRDQQTTNFLADIRIHEIETSAKANVVERGGRIAFGKGQVLFAQAAVDAEEIHEEGALETLRRVAEVRRIFNEPNVIDATATPIVFNSIEEEPIDSHYSYAITAPPPPSLASENSGQSFPRSFFDQSTLDFGENLAERISCRETDDVYPGHDEEWNPLPIAHLAVIRAEPIEFIDPRLLNIRVGPPGSTPYANVVYSSASSNVTSDETDDEKHDEFITKLIATRRAEIANAYPVGDGQYLGTKRKYASSSSSGTGSTISSVKKESETGDILV